METLTGLIVQKRLEPDLQSLNWTVMPVLIIEATALETEIQVRKAAQKTSGPYRLPVVSSRKRKALSLRERVP